MMTKSSPLSVGPALHLVRFFLSFEGCGKVPPHRKSTLSVQLPASVVRWRVAPLEEEGLHRRCPRKGRSLGPAPAENRKSKMRMGRTVPYPIYMLVPLKFCIDTPSHQLYFSTSQHYHSLLSRCNSLVSSQPSLRLPPPPRPQPFRPLVTTK